MNDYARLRNKTIIRVMIDPDHENLVFVDSEHTPYSYGCYGDCCSHTWIEHISNLDQLVGATIVSVEPVDMPEIPAEQQHEQDVAYGQRFNTDKGYCLIEYRNSSNGYYGGSLKFNGNHSPTKNMLPLTEDF